MALPLLPWGGGRGQHHLGVGPGAGEHPTSGSARRGTATDWVGRAGAGDSTAALPKPRCARLVPGWYPSGGRSQGAPRAANPPSGCGSTPWGRILPSSPGLVWMVSSSLLQLLLEPSKSCSIPLHPWKRGSSTSPPNPVLCWACAHPPWRLCCLSPAPSPPFLGHFNLVSDLSLGHACPLGEGNSWPGPPEPHGLGAHRIDSNLNTAE